MISASKQASDRRLAREANDCEVDGCVKPADGSLCAMHAKRRQRGIPDDAPLRERLSPQERVVQSAIELADADAEDQRAYDRALERLRKSVERWSRSLFAVRGGKARLAALTPDQRTELAKRAARARWDRR